MAVVKGAFTDKIKATRLKMSQYGITQEMVARRLNKDRARVSNWFNSPGASDEVNQMYFSAINEMIAETIAAAKTSAQ